MSWVAAYSMVSVILMSTKMALVYTHLLTKTVTDVSKFIGTEQESDLLCSGVCYTPISTKWILPVRQTERDHLVCSAVVMPSRLYRPDDSILIMVCFTDEVSSF